MNVTWSGPVQRLTTGAGAGVSPAGASLVMADGRTWCGTCGEHTSLPCPHFPNWFDYRVGQISDRDVERIAQRVVELLRVNG